MRNNFKQKNSYQKPTKNREAVKWDFHRTQTKAIIDEEISKGEMPIFGIPLLGFNDNYANCKTVTENVKGLSES